MALNGVFRFRRVGIAAAVAAGLAALLIAGRPAAALAQDGPVAAYEAAPQQTTVIAAGTEVRVKALTALSSSTANIGDTVRLEVASDDRSGLPPGMVFVGRVTDVVRATPRSAGLIHLHLCLPDQAHTGPGGAFDAGAVLTGEAYHAKGNTTAVAAAGGALLGFVRKRKLGDLLEGGILGAVAGTAIDQVQKHSASDVAIADGGEFTVKLARPMKVETIVEAEPGR